VGALAPDFTLVDALTGESVSLASLRGKPVWINFWATWCPPCREEMPEMQQFYEKYHAQGLAIVGVNVQESDSQVQQYVKEGAFTWTFVLDPEGTTTDRYLIGGLPSHFFIDAEGVVQAVHMGGLENMAGRKAPIEEYLAKIMGSR
jgi:thiol-disulfide isomerase/thioredoxin